jgi:hypothetical protein
MSFLVLDMLAQIGPERLESWNKLRIFRLEAMKLVQIVFDLCEIRGLALLMPNTM